MSKIIRFAAGFILVLTASAHAIANYTDSSMVMGSNALANRDNVEALRLLKPLAENGNAEAQWMVGTIYHATCQDAKSEAAVDHVLKNMGITRPPLVSCVPRNESEAAIWFQKSAKQGNPKGEVFLGQAYEMGQGLPQNYAMAASWYQKAADQGDADGQYNLEDMRKEGKLRGNTADKAENSQ